MLIALIMVIGSSILFRLGGWGKYSFFCMNPKYWRWWGIGILACVLYHTIIPFFAYWAVTSVPYGDNSCIKKYIGRNGNWILYGGLFGFASFSVLSLGTALIGSLLGAVSFLSLMILSNDGIGGWKLDHKLVEIIFPLVTCAIYIIK